MLARYDLRKIQMAFYVKKSFGYCVQWYFVIVLFFMVLRPVTLITSLKRY